MHKFALRCPALVVPHGQQPLKEKPQPQASEIERRSAPATTPGEGYEFCVLINSLGGSLSAKIHQIDIVIFDLQILAGVAALQTKPAQVVSNSLSAIFWQAESTAGWKRWPMRHVECLSA